MADHSHDGTAERAQTIRQLAKVRADNRELLNAIVGNQGTALGRRNFTADGDPQGEPCIIVYVPHKLHEAFLANNLRVPPVLSTKDETLEAPTDVVVTTKPNNPKGDPVLSQENEALIQKLQWLDGTLNQLVPGAQLGGFEFGPQGLGGYSGTLGYAVRETDSATVGFLTNQHVGGMASRSMYVPGGSQASVRVGVTRFVREHYPDDEWIKGINEPFAYVRSDAAFVAVEDRFADLLVNEIPNIGKLSGELEIDLDTMDPIGMRVRKVGRTTGLTEGVIVAFGYGINNENEIIDRRLDAEPANIYTDFLIAPAAGFQEFSAPGDSGSPIVTEKDGNTYGLGLLWGGWPTDIGRATGVEDLTYGINLSRLLDMTGLELL